MQYRSKYRYLIRKITNEPDTLKVLLYILRECKSKHLQDRILHPSDVWLRPITLISAYIGGAVEQGGHF